MRQGWLRYNNINFKALGVAWWYKSVIARRRLRNEIQSVNMTILSEVDTHRSEFQSNRVVIFTSVSLFTDHVITEYALAAELVRAGASVTVMVCDRTMPICHAHDRYSCGMPSARSSGVSTDNVCGSCQRNRFEFVSNSNLDVRTYSSYVNDAEGRVPSKGVEEDSRTGVIRYLATSEVPHDEISGLSDQYQRAATIAANVVQNVIDTEKPSLIIGHHGIYVPQGVVNKVCKENQVTFYSWHFGYRKSTLIFSKGNTYHKELGEICELPDLSSSQRTQISNYLASRWSGAQDWIHFNRKPKSLVKDVSGLKRVVFYSSVDWDAALHFDKNIYKNQFDFVDDLLESAPKFPNIQFTIRVHPAEATGNHRSYTKLDEYINSKSPSNNVTVIPSSDKTSSYELAENCDLAIVYNTKLGVELTSMGIPTVVAGESWVRGRGFTWDVGNRSDLDLYLSKVGLLYMTEEMKQKALSFAYYFYFQRCIDVSELQSVSEKFHIQFEPSAYSPNGGLPFIVQRLLKHELVKANA